MGVTVRGGLSCTLNSGPCDSVHATSTHSLREGHHVYRQPNFCQD